LVDGPSATPVSRVAEGSWLPSSGAATLATTEAFAATSLHPRIPPAPTASAVPVRPAAVPVASFEGLHFGTNGPYTDGYVPPDVQVAPGPDHIVEMVNALGRICTQQGGEVQTFPLDPFFGATATDLLSDT